MKISNQKFTKSTDLLGRMVSLKIDRPMGSKHPKYDWSYPINYGFVPDTEAPDGEELDAYVIGLDKPIKIFSGLCIAVIHRTNDDDDKLVVVPEEKKEITDEEIRFATHFQEQYFKSEILRFRRI